MDELLKLYNYIKICLIYHHAKELRRKQTLKDAQHDLFLYIYEKGVKELNSQSKRYIFTLSLYYPIYIRSHKYSRKTEEVLLDLENNPIEVGVSYFPNGDVLYDLNLISEQKSKIVLTAKSHNVRPIIVTFVDESKEIFDSIDIFVKKIGCRRSTANLWLRFGMPTRKYNKKMIRLKLREGKYDHIKKLEYLV